MAAEVIEIPGADEEPRWMVRVKRRREFFIDRLGHAQSSREKLERALDYFKAMTSDHRVDPIKAAQATDHLADRLIDSADELSKTIRRNR